MHCVFTQICRAPRNFNYLWFAGPLARETAVGASYWLGGMFRNSFLAGEKFRFKFGVFLQQIVNLMLALPDDFTVILLLLVHLSTKLLNLRLQVVFELYSSITLSLAHLLELKNLFLQLIVRFPHRTMFMLH